jgi:hypothetical protein
MAQVGIALYTGSACVANLEDRTYCMSVRRDPPCRLSRCSLCLRCRTSVPIAPHMHVCRESVDDWEHRTSRLRRLSARFCRRREQEASRARCHCGIHNVDLNLHGTTIAISRVAIAQAVRQDLRSQRRWP